MRARILGILVVLAAVSLPGPAGAQRPATDPGAAPLLPLAWWRIELEQVERKLDTLEARALTDPELRELSHYLDEAIERAMVEVDPTVEATRARIDVLTRRLQDRGRGDPELGARAGDELRQLEARLATVREAALRRPEITDRVEVFDELLRRRMVEIDPEAELLLERYRELSGRLLQAAGERGERAPAP